MSRVRHDKSDPSTPAKLATAKNQKMKERTETAEIEKEKTCVKKATPNYV